MRSRAQTDNREQGLVKEEAEVMVTGKREKVGVFYKSLKLKRWVYGLRRWRVRDADDWNGSGTANTVAVTLVGHACHLVRVQPVALRAAPDNAFAANAANGVRSGDERAVLTFPKGHATTA